MIEILKDWDEEMRKNPYLPYTFKPPDKYLHHCDDFKNFHAEMIDCKCSTCGLEFRVKKPITGCPLEKNHHLVVPDLDAKQKSIRRMLS